MKCKYCGKPITGEYVEEWTLACPAHRTGYAHPECSKDASTFRTVVMTILAMALLTLGAILEIIYS